MAKTIIKVDLNQSPYENDKLHNRWHPDIPMVEIFGPGDGNKLFPSARP